MKCQFFNFILLLLGLLLSQVNLANNPGKDFLITLDGTKLTGNIKDVSLSNGKNQISFQNDFGKTYIIHPATVYGFSFREAGGTYMFESKNLNGEWLFLRVEKKGEVISLYTSSERQLQFVGSQLSPILVEEKNPQNWIQFKDEPPFKIYRINYKGILRKRMSDYPELVMRIGKKGFRYQNLSAMVDLYNKFHGSSK